MTRKVLSREPSPEEKRIDRILDRIAERGLYEHLRTIARDHHVTVREVIEKNRKRAIVNARHAFFLRLHDECKFSWMQIGDLFETDHANVIVRPKLRARMERKEPSIDRTITLIADWVRKRGHARLAAQIEAGEWRKP